MKEGMNERMNEGMNTVITWIVCIAVKIFGLLYSENYAIPGVEKDLDKR